MTGWVSLLRLFFLSRIAFYHFVAYTDYLENNTAINKGRIFSDILKIRSGIPSVIRYIK